MTVLDYHHRHKAQIYREIKSHQSQFPFIEKCEVAEIKVMHLKNVFILELTPIFFVFSSSTNIQRLCYTM